MLLCKNISQVQKKRKRKLSIRHDIARARQGHYSYNF